LIIQSKLKHIHETKRRSLLLTVFAALSLATFIDGCKKNDFVPVDGICPLVVSTDPANGATSVALNKVISITF
jgi:hypothetical protein